MTQECQSCLDEQDRWHLHCTLWPRPSKYDRGFVSVLHLNSLWYKTCSTYVAWTSCRAKTVLTEIEYAWDRNIAGSGLLTILGLTQLCCCCVRTVDWKIFQCVNSESRNQISQQLLTVIWAVVGWKLWLSYAAARETSPKLYWSNSSDKQKDFIILAHLYTSVDKISHRLWVIRYWILQWLLIIYWKTV